MTTQPVHRHVPQFTLGDRLRRIRRDEALTQGAFAVKLGVDPKRYAAWESDTNVPRGGDLIALAKRIYMAFGVDEFWLLDLPDPKGRDGSGRPEDPADTGSDKSRYPTLLLALTA